MHVTPEALVDALRSEGLRITKSRVAVCTAIADAHDEHLSAADILERARRSTGGRIDQSTVYRTLDTLEQIGQIRHVHFGHGPGVYHLTDDARHHHLVCERCGRSVDVPIEDVRPLLRRITEQHGFAADDLHFALSGVCRDCAASPPN